MAACLGADTLTTVPRKPVTWRTSAVSSILIMRGGRSGGEWAMIEFSHWKYTAASSNWVSGGSDFGSVGRYQFETPLTIWQHGKGGFYGSKNGPVSGTLSVLVLSHGSHINHITDSLLPSADDLAKIQLLVDVKLQCGHPNVFGSEPATSAVCVDVHSVGCRVSRALSEVFGEVWRSLTARLPAHGKVQHHGWRFGLQSNYKGCAP